MPRHHPDSFGIESLVVAPDRYIAGARGVEVDLYLFLGPYFEKDGPVHGHPEGSQYPLCIAQALFSLGVIHYHFVIPACPDRAGARQCKVDKH